MLGIMHMRNAKGSPHRNDQKRSVEATQFYPKAKGVGGGTGEREVSYSFWLLVSGSSHT